MLQNKNRVIFKKVTNIQSCAVVRGSAEVSTAAARCATTSTRRTGAAVSGFVAPGLGFELLPLSFIFILYFLFFKPFNF
jgi:hypothetical protein